MRAAANISAEAVIMPIAKVMEDTVVHFVESQRLQIRKKIRLKTQIKGTNKVNSGKSKKDPRLPIKIN